MVEVLLPGKSGKDVELTIENDTVTVADNPATPEGEGAKKPEPAWKRAIQLPFRIPLRDQPISILRGWFSGRLSKETFSRPFSTVALIVLGSASSGRSSVAA